MTVNCTIRYESGEADQHQNVAESVFHYNLIAVLYSFAGDAAVLRVEHHQSHVR